MSIDINKNENSLIKSPLRITIKISTVLSQTQTYTSTKIKRIYSIIERKDFSKAHLIVSYGKGLTNHGIYFSKRELANALRVFTEKGLVGYIRRSFDE